MDDIEKHQNDLRAEAETRLERQWAFCQAWTRWHDADAVILCGMVTTRLELADGPQPVKRVSGGLLRA